MTWHHLLFQKQKNYLANQNFGVFRLYISSLNFQSYQRPLSASCLKIVLPLETTIGINVVGSMWHMILFIPN